MAAEASRYITEEKGVAAGAGSASSAVGREEVMEEVIKEGGDETAAECPTERKGFPVEGAAEGSVEAEVVGSRVKSVAEDEAEGRVDR